MSAPAPASNSIPTYDVVLAWLPLVEEIVAAECFGQAKLLALKSQGKVFSDDTLARCTGKRVLIMGSYFSAEQIGRLMQVAHTISVKTYGDEFVRLSQECSPFAHAKEATIEAIHFAKFDHQQLQKEFPRAVRLLRRAFDPESEAHGEDDEAFYRGLLHCAVTLDQTREEAIRDWLRGEVEGDDQVLIQAGLTVAAAQSHIANDIVTANSIVIPRSDGKHTGVVVTGSTLIMPIAKALVADPDVADVGVVIRYNLKEKTTSLTFYTPNETDLTWVEQEPWNGGGKADCKGTTLQTLVPITQLLEWLQA